MPNYTKVLLSGSTNGKNIKISSSGSSGANTIHQAVNNTVDKDEIWVYATNTDEDYQMFYVMYGGTTHPDDLVEVNIPPESGAVLVIPGWILFNGLYVKGYAETANVINVNGFVNRITSGS